MTQIDKRKLVITREMDIPLEMAWKGWTDPKLVMLWWGPADYTSPRAEIDLREGGRYLFAMRAPQEQGGQVYYSAGVYSRILPLERLEFTQMLADREGNPVRPTDVGMPADFPETVHFVVEFRALDAKRTELKITESEWPPGRAAEYAELGMKQSLDKFADRLG